MGGRESGQGMKDVLWLRYGWSNLANSIGEEARADSVKVKCM
jgi:hypothetical protein